MKINQSTLVLLFTLPIILSFNSCTEESNTCDTPRDGEAFTISPAALSYISNYQNAEKVIFKTEQGEEVSYDISVLDGFQGEYLIGGICDDDASMSQAVQGTYETLYLTLTNDAETNQSLYVQLTEIPLGGNPDNIKESVSVSLGNSFPVGSEGESLFGTHINDPNEKVLFHDSLDILGERFYNVFENVDIDPAPSIEIRYTQSEGIVHFKNNTNAREYIYERVE